MEIRNLSFVNGIYGADLHNVHQNTSFGRKEVPENIQKMIFAIQNASDYEEVEDYFETATENGELEELNTTTYRSGEYIISDMLRHNGENIADIFKELTKKNIRIAPQFVDVIHKDDNTILITKIEGTGGKDLIPFSQGYGMLDENSKSEAYKDIQRLLKAGIVNNEMARSSDEWFITPESKKVIIADWSSLRPVQNGEQQHILNKCYNILYRK